MRRGRPRGRHRDWDDTVTRHLQHRAAPEDADRAVRRALSLACDVRQFSCDAAQSLTTFSSTVLGFVTLF